MTSLEERQIISRLTDSVGEGALTFPSSEEEERYAREIIKEACNCAEQEAAEHLTSLRDRGLITLELSPGGRAIAPIERMPVAGFRWASSTTD